LPARKNIGSQRAGSGDGQARPDPQRSSEQDQRSRNSDWKSSAIYSIIMADRDKEVGAWAWFKQT
jgi:hypothetical protein